MKPAALFCFFLCFLQGDLFAKTSKPLEVIAYYTGDGDLINKYPVEKLTHIIFSFLHLKADTIAFNREEQKTTLRKLVALKQTHPGLKVMISMGGWSACAPCSDVFSSAESRKNFARSVLNVCQEYGADGIDLDWEYPAIKGYPGHAFKPEDKNNFTELLKELHQLLSPNYELSFAAGGFTEFLENSIDWEAVFPLVNRVNLMTYDFVGGYSTVTGHQTSLFSVANQIESTDHCVSWLLQRGYPADKLVIGSAFYGRTWENVPDTNHGLFQPGRFKAFVDHKAFETKLSTDSGWVHYRDKKAKAPYSYNARLRQFATYDDPESVARKVKYARRKKLKGIMFWELRTDSYTGGLLDEVDKAVKK